MPSGSPVKEVVDVLLTRSKVPEITTGSEIPAPAPKASIADLLPSV